MHWSHAISATNTHNRTATHLSVCYVTLWTNGSQKTQCNGDKLQPVAWIQPVKQSIKNQTDTDLMVPSRGVVFSIIANNAHTNLTAFNSAFYFFRCMPVISSALRMRVTTLQTKLPLLMCVFPVHSDKAQNWGGRANLAKAGTSKQHLLLLFLQPKVPECTTHSALHFKTPRETTRWLKGSNNQEICSIVDFQGFES